MRGSLALQINYLYPQNNIEQYKHEFIANTGACGYCPGNL